MFVIKQNFCDFVSVISARGHLRLSVLKISYRPHLKHTVLIFSLQEMQESMKMLNPKQGLPDFSEMLTNWAGGASTKTPPSSKQKTQSKPSRRK